MLQFNILRICKARGIEKPFAYFKNHGFSASTITRIISANRQSFSLKTIEPICLLLNCTPNDLLEWTPSGAQQADPTLALHKLQRTEVLANVSQLLNGASLEQLKKMEAVIRKEINQ